jgi:hypothetical protein
MRIKVLFSAGKFEEIKNTNKILKKLAQERVKNGQRWMVYYTK